MALRRNFVERIKYWVLVGTLAALAAGMAIAAPASRTGPASIVVNARPIDVFKPGEPSRFRFGSLVYRGGLALTSPAPDFGGISAIRLDLSGERFIALSDHGNWFVGRIVYANGRPTGLADVKTAPMLDEDGAPLAAKGWFDSEALALNGNEAYVAIERVNQIVKFDLSEGVLNARGKPIDVPPALRRLPFNKGVEGMVYVPQGQPLAGTLIALSERGLDKAGNLQAFLIGGPSPGAFSVRRTQNYDISDAALLPNGDLLVLERKFSIFSGGGIRIRRIAQAVLRPGAVVDGPVIFEADLGYEIDNMEALDVHRTGEGDIVLTMMSDDNFSPIQRTLLLQFTLLDD
jgi:hypothetical protein